LHRNAKGPTKLELETCNPRQESVLVYLPIPSHKVSLTVFVWEQEAEESAVFQVIPRSKLPHLTLVHVVYYIIHGSFAKNVKWSCLPFFI